MGIDFRNGVTQKYVGLARNNTGFRELNEHLSKHLHSGEKFDETAPEFHHATSFILGNHYRGWPLRDNEFLNTIRLLSPAPSRRYAKAQVAMVKAAGEPSSLPKDSTTRTVSPRHRLQCTLLSRAAKREQQDTALSNLCLSLLPRWGKRTQTFRTSSTTPCGECADPRSIYWIRQTGQTKICATTPRHAASDLRLAQNLWRTGLTDIHSQHRMYTDDWKRTGHHRSDEFCFLLSDQFGHCSLRHNTRITTHRSWRSGSMVACCASPMWIPSNSNCIWAVHQSVQKQCNRILISTFRGQTGGRYHAIWYFRTIRLPAHRAAGILQHLPTRCRHPRTRQSVWRAPKRSTSCSARPVSARRLPRQTLSCSTPSLTQRISQPPEHTLQRHPDCRRTHHQLPPPSCRRVFPRHSSGMLEAEDIGLFKFDILSQRGSPKSKTALRTVEQNKM